MTQISQFRELSIARAVWARLRQPDARVIPCKQTHLRLKGTVDGGGLLLVGKRWPGQRFLPSELVIDEGGRVTVHGEFNFYTGCSVAVQSGAHLELGGGGVNEGAVIRCFSSISIGREATIGPEVYIRDSHSHVLHGAKGEVTEPITIGDHVWIGARATILKGVTIGDGAIIGAGSVVSRDVEPNTLVAGSPARFVREATWEHEPG